MKPPSLNTIMATVRGIAKAGLLAAKEGEVTERRVDILEREAEKLKESIKRLESRADISNTRVTAAVGRVTELEAYSHEHIAPSDCVWTRRGPDGVKSVPL